MPEEQIERLNQFCGIAEKDLDKLKELLGKIIDAKKKISDSGKKDDMMLKQAQDVLATMENLEKINLKLPGAIKEIKELCQKMRSLIGPQVERHDDLSGPSSGSGGVIAGKK